MQELEVTEMPVNELVPYEGNAKLHPHFQVDQIAASISEFGNCDPIGVWHDGDGNAVVVEGHGRLLALKKLGIGVAPVIFLDHLDDEGRKAYGLAHNQLTMNSRFDFDVLDQELDKLSGEFDMSEFGFDMFGDIDIDDYFHEPRADGPEPPRTVVCECCGKEFEL